jgi:phosphoribosyl-ATP pyrophosphohydrolase/phosphoribosyl-AMP cyclohydrolase
MLISKAQQADSLDWDKAGGLIPAVVQDSWDGRVLMQAWMNREALQQSIASGRVTFWSRSRQQLWVKGATSGNFLELVAIHADCDHDSLLVLARPRGPACHRGTDSCFDDGTTVIPDLAFLASLERVVEQRERDRPDGSYTTTLLSAGIRHAQKVGGGRQTAWLPLPAVTMSVRESADLLYHLMVLLRSRALPFGRVIATLRDRHG